MKFTKEKQGDLLVLFQALLWSLFPVVTTLTIMVLPPLIALGLNIFFSTIFFSVLMTVRKKWHELRKTKAFQDMLLATLFTGIIYYVLSFFGLQHTSPGNAGIIALAEVFFSYLFFNLWQKDSLPGVHLLGAVFVCVGVIIIFAPSVKGFQIGDLLILCATAIAPLGNFFQRRARLSASSETIIFVRSLVSMIVIFGLAFLFHETFTFQQVQNVLWLLIFNGVFLFGLAKILWVEGIHRITVTKANALSGISPLLTLLFAWLLLNNAPTIYQLFAILPTFIGVYLLSKTTKKTKN
jgi:drug/metabolite transporter (DMT)-like permease